MAQQEDKCCDNWWDELTKKEKKFIHFFHYDVRQRSDYINQFAEITHETRFGLEARDRKTGE